MIRARIHLPETFFASLGAALTVALASHPEAQWMLLQTGLLLVLYVFAVIRTSGGSRLRLLVNYLAAWVLYAGSSSLVEALHRPPQQERLMEWDRRIFCGSPSVLVQGRLMPWINDLLSLGYLSYHVYLHWAFIEAFFKSHQWRTGFGRLIFTAFTLGFAGYFLFPAASPARAFPGLFKGAIAGSWPTRLNESVNTSLAARYDAFPSLHLLVTLALATWDWHWRRSRFWIMLVPSVLMVMATLALRLHYAVDLLASLVLYGLLLCLVKPSRSSL